MATKKIPYVNKFTGDVLITTKRKALQLSEDWEAVEFTTNEDGKPVMRLQLNGATVDIFENETQEVAENVNAAAE
jgi:hypothetical protein